MVIIIIINNNNNSNDIIIIIIMIIIKLSYQQNKYLKVGTFILKSYFYGRH